MDWASKDAMFDNTCATRFAPEPVPTYNGKPTLAMARAATQKPSQLYTAEPSRRVAVFTPAAVKISSTSGSPMHTSPAICGVGSSVDSGVGCIGCGVGPSVGCGTDAGVGVGVGSVGEPIDETSIGMHNGTGQSGRAAHHAANESS